MAYRKKIYVVFDVDDIIYFNMFQAWCTGETQELIHFETSVWNNVNSRKTDGAENSILEKMRNVSCVVVLVSAHTNPLCPQIQAEINNAIRLNKPIIVVNINGKRSIDNDLCPSALKNYMAIHISFNAKIMQKAIDVWPDYYDQNSGNGSGAYFFKPQVYQNLGI